MYEELIEAIPVVIGGLLAVLGGVAGQIITHRLSMSREKRVLLRERIESLVKSLHGHSQWLSDKFNTMIFRNEDYDVFSPLDEAKMLQELYFPELAFEILALMQAQIPMMEFISNQRIARMKDEAAWLQSWDQSPYNEMYEKYLTALNAATKKCRNILNTHLES